MIKKYIGFIFCFFILKLNAQNSSDSPRLKAIEVIKVTPASVISGDTLNLIDCGIYGVVSADKAVRYKDKIYLVCKSENISKFMFMFAFGEIKTVNTRLYLLEFDTNGRYKGRVDFEVAENGKEYILENIEFSLRDNQILALYSIRNVLSRRKIFFLSAVDLDTRKKKCIKVASIPFRSRDYLNLIQDNALSGVLIEYMKFDKTSETYTNKSTIKLDKELEVVDSKESDENYDKQYIKQYDSKTGITYTLVSQGGRYLINKYSASSARKFELKIRPDRDQVIRADYDENNATLCVMLRAERGYFEGWSVDYIQFTGDTFIEERQHYLSLGTFKSLSAFNGLLNKGFTDVTDMDEKKIEKIKKYYYYQSGIFDTSTRRIVLTYNIHEEYETRRREETKHYVQDNRGNRRYSHSTYRYVTEVYYINGPVVVIIVSEDGSVTFRSVGDVVNSKFDRRLELQPVQAGGG